MKIALTGHRPERLGLPFDVTKSEWEPIRKWISKKINEYIDKETELIECISGVASGSDIAFGYVVARLMKFSDKVRLILASPFPGYNENDIHYNFLKDNCNKWYYACDEYDKNADDMRDDYMARECDVMLAIFDGGEYGGVWSTMKKAMKYGKPIICCPIEILKGDKDE